MKIREKEHKTPDHDELDRPVARFQIELLAERMADLGRMQRLSGARTKREVCELAFTAFEALLDQAARGRLAGFLTPTGEFLEMVFPALQNARRYEEKTNSKKKVAGPDTVAGDLREAADV